MRKFLLIYSASTTLLLVGGVAWLNHSIDENKRLRRNQEALTSEIEHYKSENGDAEKIGKLCVECKFFHNTSDVKKQNSL